MYRNSYAMLPGPTQTLSIEIQNTHPSKKAEGIRNPDGAAVEKGSRQQVRSGIQVVVTAQKKSSRFP
jgi:hypothetical protein